MSSKPPKPIQGSLFEEDYLLRTLGGLANSPEVALTELVANAWDAGASRVEIFIPNEIDGELVVGDDGTGMTKDQFRKRWMTLGYNRVRHQGLAADFPPERRNWRRPAYGRNGVGRHGLLCFAPKYKVETWRDGRGSRFVISTSSGKDPFVILTEEFFERDGHGSRLSVDTARHLPDPDNVRDVLAARFLHDPQFAVFVNGKSVPLSEHAGLIDQMTLQVTDVVKAEAFFVDSLTAGRTTQYQGVAFWVGGRLVGEPSWIVGKTSLIDGRTRIAKRYTMVVKSDDLFDEVLPDWSAFKTTETTGRLFEVVCEYFEKVFKRISTDRIQETKNSVIEDHRVELGTLQPLAQIEVKEFIEEIATANPMMPAETISIAARAVINLERSRSGAALLEKLAKLSEEDVAGLDRLLSEWSVRDALTVLDEIDRRLAVIEAIKKLSSAIGTDELHTLHPLVTQARWLFGPEFDSPEYSSNLSLVNAVQHVFGKRIDASAFLNSRRRPDLVVLADATISAVGTEAYDETKGLNAFRDVLLVEVKRGDSTIDRTHMHQATDYVEDLIKCGHLEGPPFIKAFVVGHRLNDKIEATRKIGDKPERARVIATTYGQLVRTGEKRLFALRDKLKTRYEEVSGNALFEKVSGQPAQLMLSPVTSGQES